MSEMEKRSEMCEGENRDEIESKICTTIQIEGIKDNQTN